MPDYRRLAVAGPYFVLHTAPAPDDTPPPGYRPLRELYATGPDSLLAARIREVARRLGTAEPRVAASILHLGLAARFCSVSLGAAVLLGTVPELDPDRAHLRVPEQGPIDLWAPHRPQPASSGTSPGEAGSEPLPDLPELADRLHRVLVQGQLAPLATAVRAAVPVSERLLDGNAASALAGTLRMLRPHAAPGRAEALVARLLGRPPLAGTGALHTGGLSG
ncbi:IucA/IucC family C-terminal-domain containing protein [Kitasatospora sp. A2-31]|uniref:IucA/IucC family C-terminal-domain containing protein n=1 Tax=Kitasatospora sp. A2-31 TaxID=2916414 RepID=UPI001EEC0B4F|nr:IucA/IucC family C-terminal-domain containing protein [Kitasatospora sp. A2-31]MCG6498148.1 hypothetical protein [Kitasatospora sp. A2-31]